MKLIDLVNLHIKENTLSHASIAKYKHCASLFTKNTGIENINHITHQIIIDWRDNIVSRSSAGNWNNLHRHMRAILQTAVEFDYLSDNLFKKVKSITHYATKKHLLTSQQINTVLSICEEMDHDWFWKAIIIVLANTGMRRRQLIGLKWQDIDFNDQTILLTAEFSKTKREYKIPFGEKVFASLLLVKEKMHTRPAEQVFNITKINARYKSNAMNEENVARFFTRLSKLVGFPVSAHRFRHTFATKLANNGKTNIKTVQNLLGHSNVYTTLSYVHPNIDNMRDAVNLL